MTVAIAPAPAHATDLLQANVETPGWRPAQVRYEWRVGGVPLGNATGQQLPPKSVRKGDQVTVHVDASASDGKEVAADSTPVTIDNAPPILRAVSVAPERPKVIDRLSAKVEAEDPDGDPIHFTYQWYRGDQPLPGAAGESLDGAMLRKGDQVWVRVIPSDGELSGASMDSPPVVVQDSPPQFLSTPPDAGSGGIIVYPIQMKDPDGDPVTLSLASPVEGARLDGQTLQWHLPSIPGQYEVVLVATDPGGASARQSIRVTVSPNPAR